MNAMRGTLYRFIWRSTVIDCDCTPATPHRGSGRAVEHTQRALDFDREVDVAGRIDDVDVMIVPLQWSQRRRS